MKVLRNMPIKRKVTVVMLLTSAAALLLAGGGLFLFQKFSFEESFKRDLSALSDIIATQSATQIDFTDSSAANETLGALKEKPIITDAQLWLKDDTSAPLARYPEKSKWKPALDLKGDNPRYEGDYMIYSKLILDPEKKPVGTLHLRADYKRELRKLLLSYAGILAVVLTFSILLTALLSARLQRVISEPILRLAQTAKIVAEQKDYSVRASKLEGDEIGQFTDAFNHMLEQIQGRDSALQLSHQKFETLVNSIEGVVWEADPETFRFIYVSKQAERLLGYPLEQWLETESFWQDHLHPNDRERAVQTSRIAMIEKRFCSQEYRMLALNGSILWIRSYSTVVLEEDKPILLRGVLLDFTREKKAAEELASLHTELLQTSHQAGMAEVATGVLHNVGNVLNSVNVSTTLVRERIRESEVTTLGRVAALLGEHQADLPAFLTTHPKGKMVAGFIQRLADQLSKERTETLGELELLAKNIEHIKEIVALQQSYARVCGVVESLPITELIEDALQINSTAFRRHGVEVVRQFEPVPLVSVNRHKVLQILVNLLSNAKYAVDQATVENKLLVLSVALDGNNRVSISVQDNGIGIAPENLTRIFSHGFTTKKEGHGFGLHSGALAAKEMGGSLRVHSAGAGRGATFTLELPIRAEQNKK
jgi:PAS domain S-box-containing protein